MTREEAIDFIYLECKPIFFDKDNIIYPDGSHERPNDIEDIELMLDKIVGKLIVTNEGEFFILKKLKDDHYFFEQRDDKIKEYFSRIITEYNYKKGL